eukprot:10016055-Ditylum_brightwellii.AAC.1
MNMTNSRVADDIANSNNTKKEEGYFPQTAYLCHKIHWDMKDDLIAVISMHTSLERLADIIHGGEDNLDNITQHNKA